MPVYFVVVDLDFVGGYMPVYRIIHVMETTLDDMANNNIRFTPRPEFPHRQAFVFYREPDNPFKEQATKEEPK